MTKLKQRGGELLDIILGKIISRKLTVFAIASYGMFEKSIESSDWTMIAGLYIGSETVISAIKEFSKIKNGANNSN